MWNFAMWTLGALMCSLAAFNADEQVGDFHPQKMEGKWYIMGSATNAGWFVNNTRNAVGFIVWEPVGGHLILTFVAMNHNNDCENTTYQAKKTGQQSYSFYSEAWHNQNEMLIVDVEYDNFALAHTNKTKEDKLEVFTNLYSRTLEVNETLQEKFKMYSEAQGVDPKNIVFLAPDAAGCH